MTGRHATALQASAFAFAGRFPLIVLAKRRGIIAQAKPLLDRLIWEQGIRVDAAVIGAALRLTGE